MHHRTWASGLVIIAVVAGLVVTASPGSAAVTLERTSVGTGGTQSDGHSVRSAMSTDGRYVVFDSRETNLVAGDTSSSFKALWRDRQTGVTERVVFAVGGGAPDAQSSDPYVSDDGRVVAYWSSATNLVAGDTNAKNDVFAYDRSTGTTSYVSVSATGGPGNGVSNSLGITADGRSVLFASDSSNLVEGDTNGKVDLFLRDLSTNQTRILSDGVDGLPANGDAGNADISPDGRYLAFYSAASNLVPGDTNNGTDAFVKDLQAGTIERVNVTSAEAQANPSNQGFRIGVSADGRRVVFSSDASNLVPETGTTFATDVFLRDRQAGTTSLISRDNAGVQGNSSSYSPQISDDGTKVAFESAASNLVSGDTNNAVDSYLRDLTTGTTARLSIGTDGTQPSSSVMATTINGAGTRFAFATTTAMVAGDTNNAFDVFTGSVPETAPVDSTPPTLTVPADQAVEAQGPGGATATFVATATDDTDPQPTVTCTPASGSEFPLGTTIVECTAEDAAGNTSSDSFVVDVDDTTSPTVTLTSPGDGAAVSGDVTMTADASDLVGVTGVRFSVDGAAVDSEDTSVPYTATWGSSGATPGVHVLTAVARDAAGNTTTSSPVSVTVAPPVLGPALVWHSMGGTGALWTAEPGANPTRLLTGHVLSPSWSPDRSRIAFADDRDGSYDIWVLDVATGERVNLTPSGTGIDDSPAWSPDGTRIAFSSNRDGDDEIYTVRNDGTDVRRLTDNTGRDADPAWSPDGRQVAYVTAALDLAVVDADGTHQHLVAATPEFEADPAWAPDGSRIAYGVTGVGIDPAIFAVAPDATGRAQLTPDADRASSPAWSPDGTRIAFTANGTADSEIWSMDIDGTNRINVSNHPDVVDGGADWGVSPVDPDTTGPVLDLPDDMVVEAVGPAGTPVSFSVSASDDTDDDPAVACAPESGSVFPIGSTTVACSAGDAAGNQTLGSFLVEVADTTGPSVTVTTPAEGAAVSGTVQMTATASDAVGVVGVRFLVDGTAVGVEDTTSPFEGTWDAAGATSGSHVVQAVARDAAGNESTSSSRTVTVPPAPAGPDVVWYSNGALWVGRPGGSAPHQLYTGEAREPSWSADRSRIAFMRSGNIWILDVATGVASQLTTTVGRDQTNFPAWSPDGRWIAFSSRIGNLRTHDIWLIRPDGTGLRNLTRTPTNEKNPAWSPDATKLVFEAGIDLRVVNANGTGARTLPRTSSAYSEEPTWSPDGTTIAFARDAVTDIEIYAMSATATSTANANVRSITATADGGARHPTWSPDGRQLAFVGTRTSGSSEIMVTGAAAPESPVTISSEPAIGDLEPDWGQNAVEADTAPPVLSLPTSPLVREATSAAGAVVTYVATATDAVDPAPAVSCSPTSGSVLPIATTTVRCTAVDVFGNAAEGSFTVVVRDTTAPTARVTSPTEGARVGTRNATLTADAADAVGVTSVQFVVDGATVASLSTGPYVCTLDTSTYSLGTHTLQVIATDAAGNSTTSATISFQVVDPGDEVVWYRNGALWLGGPAGLTPQLLYTGEAREPSWSPDRRQIAFVRTGNIWILDVATGVVRQLTSTVGRDQTNHPAWSPDGASIAFSSRIGGLSTHDVWLIRVDGSGLQNLTRTSTNEKNPAWSPDATKLVFEAGYDLRIVNADGSGGRTVPRLGNTIYKEPSWSPDGTRIAFTRDVVSDAEVYTTSATATTAGAADLRAVTSTTNGGAAHPTWSPDGTKLAFSVTTSKLTAEVMVTNADSPGTPTNISTFPAAGDVEPDWGQSKDVLPPVVTVCPDYDVPGLCDITIVISNPNPGPIPGGHIDIVTGDGVTLAPNPVPNGITCVQLPTLIRCTPTGPISGGGLTTHIGVIGTRPGTWTGYVSYTCGCTPSGTVTSTTWTRSTTEHCIPAGQVIFESDSLPPLLDVFSGDISTGAVQELSAASGNEEAGAVWSPNRRRFAMHVGQPGDRRLYVVDLDPDGCVIGQHAVPNQPVADNFQADWSADGRQLAFVSDSSGNHDIWMIAVDGTGLTRVTTSAGDDRAPSFSADGSLIAFTSNRSYAGDNDWNIWTVTTAPTHSERMISTAAVGYDPEGADYSPAFSRRPGTSKIVWHTNVGPSWDLWTMNADGSGKQRIPHSTGMEEKNADWALDDTRIVYDAAVPGSPADIWMMEVDGSNRHLIASTPGHDKAPSL